MKMIAFASRHNLSGRLSVPGSKSHTIRAVLIAAMANGLSTIKNPLPSEDCLSATRAARAFGSDVKIEKGVWTIQSSQDGLKVPDDVIDCGNSGTTYYFATAISGTLNDYVVLTGDYQIRRRPVGKLLEAMSDLGAFAVTTRINSNAAPVIIKGPMKAGTIVFGGKMSQYISGMLLASARINGKTRIEVQKAIERPYLQMTVDWMTEHGIKIEYDEKNYSFFEVEGPQEYRTVETSIPSDWESVAFPLVAALVTDSEIVIEDLDLSGSQGDSVIVDILKEMGGDVTLDGATNSLKARGGNRLRGITIDCSDIPDALPILSVAACFAEGDTVLSGIESIRVKETDRVEVMKRELSKMGASIEDTDHEMIIHGGKKLTGAKVESHDDHRVAMSLAVAGLFSDGVAEISNAECVSVSFPGFYELMNGVGAGFETE